MVYVPRPIARTVREATDVPVVIVEGARAVGKTTLMRQDLVPHGYHYVSLADERELSTAADDCAGWLRRLPMPCVVDEAQLLDTLPLSVKEFVDAATPAKPLVLSGSASIGRTGLGGADPLTRRARRLTVWPLTSWEQRDQPGSVVDALFDAEPHRTFQRETTDDALTTTLLVGGFPAMAVPVRPLTRRQRLRNIRAGIESTIADGVLPDTRVDSAGARDVLDGLLRNPGGILNMSSLAQRMSLDARTVDRYVSVFQRLFLVHTLPNLATNAKRQSRARAKVHPVDTSFAMESLIRAGVDIKQRREEFGALLESYVVNQILAAAGWSSTSVDAFYWRDAKTSREVDLVLMDDNDRLVGIEVKAATSVGIDDLGGLRALARARGLHRGYVLYGGSMTRQLDDDIWALPFAALADASAFATPPTVGGRELGPENFAPGLDDDGRAGTAEPADEDAAIFVSYVHADDTRLRGRIVQFARDLAENYSFLFGRTVRLFVDRDDIVWGESWRDRLENEVSTTTFLLAAVTPRYLVSEACRREVTDFRAAAVAAREPRLILPLLWVDIEGTDVTASDDPVRRALTDSQYIDMTVVRTLERDTPEYDAILDDATQRLRATIVARARAATSPGTRTASKTESGEPDSDMLTTLQRLEDLEAPFANATDEFAVALASMIDALAVVSASAESPAAMTKDLARHRRTMAPSVERVEASTTRLSELWSEYEEGLGEFLEFARDAAPETLRDVDRDLDDLAQALERPDDAATLVTMLDHMARFSRHLVPVSRAVTGALRLVDGIRDSVDGWRLQLDPSGPSDTVQP